MATRTVHQRFARVLSIVADSGWFTSFDLQEVNAVDQETQAFTEEITEWWRVEGRIRTRRFRCWRCRLVYHRPSSCPCPWCGCPVCIDVGSDYDDYDVLQRRCIAS